MKFMMWNICCFVYFCCAVRKLSTETGLWSIRWWSQHSQKARVRPFGIPKKSSQAETLVSEIFIRNKWKETCTGQGASDRLRSSDAADGSRSFRSPAPSAQPGWGHWSSEPPGLPVAVPLPRDVYFPVGNMQEYLFSQWLAALAHCTKNSLNKMCGIKFWGSHLRVWSCTQLKAVQKT